MASISCTFTLPGGSTVTSTFQIDDSDAADLAAYGIATFPDQNDDKGNIIPKDGPWVVKFWLAAAINDITSKVTAWKQQKAADDAASAVKPIDVKIS